MSYKEFTVTYFDSTKTTGKITVSKGDKVIGVEYFFSNAEKLRKAKNKGLFQVTLPVYPKLNAHQWGGYNELKAADTHHPHGYISLSTPYKTMGDLIACDVSFGKHQGQIVQNKLSNGFETEIEVNGETRYVYGNTARESLEKAKELLES